MYSTWEGRGHRAFGELWASGRNDHGQLGNDSLLESYTRPSLPPSTVEADLETNLTGYLDERHAQAWMPFSEKFEAIQSAAFGSMHAVILTEDRTPSHSQFPSVLVGTLFSTGSNNTGQLGLSHKYDQQKPVRVEGLFHSERVVLDIQCGAKHNVAVAREYNKEETEVWTWGQGWYGRLGHGDELFKLRPKQIDSLANIRVTQVTCGRNSTAMLTQSGHIYTWGYNGHGQCGHGETVGLTSTEALPLNETGLGVVRPVRVKDIEQAIWISMGHQHTLFVSVTHKLYACGSNEFGQLGTGSRTGSEECKSTTFILVDSIPPVQSVHCGGQHTLAFTRDEVVYSWGRIEKGRCGLLNSKRDANIPRIVTGLQGLSIAKVVAGDAHNFAVTKTGRVYGWGLNKYGQLGVLTQGMDYEPVPRLLEHLRGVSDVYVGGSCAAGSSYFLIDKLDHLIRQHVRDLRSQQVRRLLRSPLAQQAIRSYDEEGYTSLHWAARLGDVENLRQLVEHSPGLYGADELEFPDMPTQDGQQRTALHIAAALGYSNCVRRLRSASKDLQKVDALGQTAAHHAVLNKHFFIAADLISFEEKMQLNPTSLLLPDRAGRTLLDLCSFEEAFPLKLRTERYIDVFLIFSPEQAVLGEQLAEFFTSKSIKCQFKRPHSTPEETIEAIEASQCVVFVVGPSSVKEGAVEREYLLRAKSLDLSIFPIWHEKITLEPDMEAIIFRFQLVDFSDSSQFSLQSNILCAAIKSLLSRTRRKKKQTTEDTPTTSIRDVDGTENELVASSLEGPFSEQVLFLSYVDADREAAVQFKSAFQQAGQMKLFDGFVCMDSAELSRAAQSCFAVLVLMSPSSVHSSVIREQILVAENNKKPLFSLQVSDQCEEVPLDFRYALAITPRFLYHPHRPQDTVAQILRALLLKHQVDQKGRQYSVLLENVRELN